MSSPYIPHNVTIVDKVSRSHIQANDARERLLVASIDRFQEALADGDNPELITQTLKKYNEAHQQPRFTTLSDFLAFKDAMLALNPIFAFERGIAGVDEALDALQKNGEDLSPMKTKDFAKVARSKDFRLKDKWGLYNGSLEQRRTEMARLQQERGDKGLTLDELSSYADELSKEATLLKEQSEKRNKKPEDIDGQLEKLRELAERRPKLSKPLNFLIQKAEAIQGSKASTPPTQ